MAFPAVSLLDSLKRAAEKPISNGGKWTAIATTTRAGEILGSTTEAWKASDAFPSEDGQYWTFEKFSGAVAFALEYRTGLTSARYTRLWVCVDEAGENGYVLQILGEATAGKVKLILEKLTNGVATTLKEKAALTIAEADRFGIAVQSGKVTAWKKAGAGAWEEILSHEDTTYTSGFVGFSGAGNSHSWRNAEAAGTVTKVQTFKTTGQKQTAKLVRKPARILTPTQAQQAKLERPRIVTASQGSSASLAHSVTRTLPTIKPKQTATLSKSSPQALTTTQGSTVVLRKAVSKTLTRTQSSAPTQEAHSTPGGFSIRQGSHAILAYATSGREPGLPYPMPFFTGPGLIDSYQHGTPEWQQDIGGVDVVNHAFDPFQWSSAYFKPYANFNEWDDGPSAGALAVATAGKTAWYMPAHTPAGAAYDVGKRKCKPLVLTFPVVGYAAAGSLVVVQFFNPTPDGVYEPEPERHPGAVKSGNLGRIDRTGEAFFGSQMKDSKGNECFVLDSGELGGVVTALIEVGGVVKGEETTPGGALEPGDTITVTFIPGPLAAPLQKVIPDDVGFPVRKTVSGGEPEKVIAEETYNVPAGQGIIQARLWGGEFGAYPYGDAGFTYEDEEPSPWAGGTGPPPAWHVGSYQDPLGVLDGVSNPNGLPLYYKAVPQDVGLYCFAAVFAHNSTLATDVEQRGYSSLGGGYPEWKPLTYYEPGEVVARSGGIYRSKGSYNQDPTVGANTPNYWEAVIVGTLSLPVPESPTADTGYGVLATADWTTTSPAPAGGDYANLLDAASHGNHMVIDYRDYGPGGSYDSAGTGAGWLDVTLVGTGVRPPNTLTPVEADASVSETIEPDNTFGPGPKGGLGKVVTITVDGGKIADAQNVHAPRVTDASDLYLYYNWMNNSREDANSGNSRQLLSGADWASTFSAEVKRLYEEAPNGDVFTDEKKVPPLLAELRLSVTVAAHTDPRWKMWDEEGSDTFALGLQLSSDLYGTALIGDLYEDGVLIGKGIPLSAADATKAGGVEFVLTQVLPTLPVEPWYYFKEDPTHAEQVGLILPNLEPFGVLSLIPLFGSKFNTLHFKYSAVFRLYFPALEDKEGEEKRVEENKEREEKGEEIEGAKGKEKEEREEVEAEEKAKEIKEEEERTEEREGIGGETETPTVTVQGSNRASARVPSNKVIGKAVTNPHLPEGEGVFGGGGEEGGGGASSTDPNVALDFYPESLPGDWIALWSCLTPGSHSGYRLRVLSLPTEGQFEVLLEKIVSGTPTVLASAVQSGVPESFTHLSLSVASGTLTVGFGGSTILSHADSTYSSGRGGIEGSGNTFAGIKNFTQGGELKDSLARNEGPLAKPNWAQLPWASNIGECFSSGFGWVATVEPTATSGAYWN